MNVMISLSSQNWMMMVHLCGCIHSGAHFFYPCSLLWCMYVQWIWQCLCQLLQRHDCLCSVYIPFNRRALTTFTYFPGIVMVITEPACLRILCFYHIIIILLYSHEIHELSWSRSVAPCIGKVYRTCTWFDLDYAWVSLSLQFKASLLGQCEQEMPLSIRLRIIWILKSV